MATIDSLQDKILLEGLPTFSDPAVHLSVSRPHEQPFRRRLAVLCRLSLITLLWKLRPLGGTSMVSEGKLRHSYAAGAANELCQQQKPWSPSAIQPAMPAAEASHLQSSCPGRFRWILQFRIVGFRSH